MMSDALEGAPGACSKPACFTTTGSSGLIVANFVFPVAMPGSGFLLYAPRSSRSPPCFLGWSSQPSFRCRCASRIDPGGGPAGLGVFSAWIMLPYFLLAYANYIFRLTFPRCAGRRGSSSPLSGKCFNAPRRSRKTRSTPARHATALRYPIPVWEFRVGPDG